MTKVKIGVFAGRNGGGFNPLSLSPVLYIRDLTNVVGGYFIDSSGRNTQCQAATTNVANDSIIMPANNTAIINALKKAHVYYDFYTNDSSPKTVLLSNIPVTSGYNVYYNTTQYINFIIFPEPQPLFFNKILNYIKLGYSLSLIEDKVFTNSTSWSLYKTGTGAINEIINSKLHQKILTGGATLTYRFNIYKNRDYLKLTVYNVNNISGTSFALVGSEGDNVETIRTNIIELKSGDNDFIQSTISHLTTFTVGVLQNASLQTPNSEVYVDRLKIEKFNFLSSKYDANKYNIVVDGDSQCTNYGGATTLWPTIIGAINYAVAGQTANKVLENIETHLIEAKSATKTNIIVLWAGVNDIAQGQTISTVLSRMMSIIAICKNNGYIPYIITQRQWGSGYGAATNWPLCQSYRDGLIANKDTYGYNIIDIAHDMRWFFQNAPSNAIYYTSGDKIHLTDVSHRIVANMVVDAIF